jgi:hypothetical protein
MMMSAELLLAGDTAGREAGDTEVGEGRGLEKARLVLVDSTSDNAGAPGSVRSS